MVYEYDQCLVSFLAFFRQHFYFRVTFIVVFYVSVLKKDDEYFMY